MFRQILVDPRDQTFQCILWQRRKGSPVLKYQLTTVTYGTAPAPFLALRVIRQLAVDGCSSHPSASTVLRENMYVDEVFFGAHDIDSAILVRQQVSELCASAGFRLRKWASNSQLLLADMDPSDHGLAIEFPLQKEESLKVLGIVWDPLTDSFQIKVNQHHLNPITKRGILSAVAKLFGPLGWIAPVLIVSKILLQALWLVKIGWDEPVPEELSSRWLRFSEQLHALQELEIPRWSASSYQLAPDASSYQLHGFADASQFAYAAVVYLRVLSNSARVCVSLIAAKIKVAPLKTLSIPRLDLLASHLLARLVETIQIFFFVL